MPKFNDILNKKAVALSYDENAAPIIVASGMGYLAERMVEVAQEAGVPVYEDNSLATMLTQLDLGSEIPVELYQAIIDIYIYFLGYVPGKKKDKWKGKRRPSGKGTRKRQAPKDKSKCRGRAMSPSPFVVEISIPAGLSGGGQGQAGIRGCGLPPRYETATP